MSEKASIVKTNFDFGWKEWKNPPPYAELAFQHQKGDILDVGCGTCQLYTYLRRKGWRGRYYGIDIKKYENYEYPKDAVLIIGNALEVEFPKVDTVILYNILEHIDDPVSLIAKSLKISKNVLIEVPKRNEEMWRFGIVEYHQLDKTHKHCGFSKEEIYKIVRAAGGKIVKYKELFPINATIGISLWKSKIPKVIVYLLSKIFSSKVFYQEIWCEVVGE